MPRHVLSVAHRLVAIGLVALVVATGHGCYRIGLYGGPNHDDVDAETNDADGDGHDAAIDADDSIADGDVAADVESVPDADDGDDADAALDGDEENDTDVAVEADVEVDAEVVVDGDEALELDVTYELVSPPSSPPTRRTSGALEVGATSDRLWIFGGFNGAAQTGLYHYDTADATWAHVPEGDAESIRQGHMMGWEPTCQMLIIFGGSSGAAGERDDIRVFDPSTAVWTTPTITGGPPTARCFSTFVWVPHQESFLLHGGSNALVTSFYADLWTLAFDATCENATWELLTPSGDIPTARSGACAAYDDARRVLVSYGGEVAGGTNGDLYELDVDTNEWTHIVADGDVPGTAAFCATTFHADLGVLLMHGGQRGLGVLGTTHVYDPATRWWTELSPAPSPGNRSDVTAVYSPHLGEGLTFGGRYTTLGGLVSVYVDETWRVRIDLL